MIELFIIIRCLSSYFTNFAVQDVNKTFVYVTDFRGVGSRGAVMSFDPAKRLEFSKHETIGKVGRNAVK